MTTRLARLESPTWNELGRMPATTWLWLDTQPPGVHVGALPQDQPVHATHLWGWGQADGGRFAVRLRLDPSLPHGLVGALLWHGHEGEGADALTGLLDLLNVEPAVAVEPVEAVEVETRAWSEGDGRIAASLPTGIAAARLTLLTVRRPGAAGSDAPLVFLAGTP